MKREASGWYKDTILGKRDVETGAKVDETNGRVKDAESWHEEEI